MDQRALKLGLYIVMLVMELPLQSVMKLESIIAYNYVINEFY